MLYCRGPSHSCYLTWVAIIRTLPMTSRLRCSKGDWYSFSDSDILSRVFLASCEKKKL